MRTALLLLPTLLFGVQDDVTPVPIQVRTLVTPCSDAGSFTLRLECTPTEQLRRDFELRVALNLGTEDVAVFDHEIRPGTRSWTVGQTVDLAFTMPLPAGQEFEVMDLVSLRLGFLDAGSQRPPAVDEHLIDLDGLADLDAFEVPRFAGAAGAARLTEVLSQASALRRADPPAAWALLSQALRDAADDSTKERIRAALIEVGGFPPAQASEVEQRIIARRIRAEKVRVLRDATLRGNRLDVGRPRRTSSVRVDPTRGERSRGRWRRLRGLGISFRVVTVMREGYRAKGYGGGGV